MFHLRCFSAIFFVLFLAESTNSQVSQVSLTIEGEDRSSLVGEHCPGTVTLFCEGVNLEYLRWNYVTHNTAFDIEQFFPEDESPSSINISDQHKAFLTIQVVSITPFSAQRNLRANFSTTLTADLVKLTQYNITRISCEQIAPELSDSVAVNISILEPSFIAPRILNITNVVATYQSGSLDSVEVQWTKLNSSCSMSAWGVFYNVILNSSANTVHQKKVNNTNCNINDCHTSFTGNLSGSNNEYRVSVIADNFLQVYPISIGYQRQQYNHIPEIVTTSCQITAKCKSSPGFANGECQILYSTVDLALNRNTSSINESVTVPLDTVVSFPYLLPGLATHYFRFTSILNQELSIIDIITVKPMLSTVVPDVPKYLSILGSYSNRGQLEFMKITWTNLKCEDFRGSPVYYNILISDSNGRNLSSMEIDQDECTISTCSAITTTKFTASLSIQLSLAAVNEAGTSLYLPKPQLYQASVWYYRPQIMFLNCSALQVSCTKSEIVNENSICTVNYHGADSQYEQILSTKMFSEDETTKILFLEPIRTTVHYLAFHLNISKTFEIKDQFIHSISDFDCSQEERNSGSINNITIIAVGILSGLLCCIFIIVISVVCTIKCINRERKNKMEKMAERTENQRRAESPVYEEINETRIFTKINLTINEAYIGISHPNN